MSLTDTEELPHLLSGYFALLGGGPTTAELARRLRAIDKLDDLAAIDGDLDDPLWRVVPQIIMHRFGLAAFQAFETRHAAGRCHLGIGKPQRRPHASGSRRTDRRSVGASVRA